MSYTGFPLKGEFTFFLIRELDVPPLGESNLMGPKKSVEVKFFTVAFYFDGFFRTHQV